MIALKLIKDGDSTAVIFPEELLNRMGMKCGDTLNVTETDGGILISKTDKKYTDDMQNIDN